MSESPLNTVESNRPGRAAAGDVPDPIRRRYLTERHGPDGLAYFVDAQVNRPAFRDDGRRLSSDRNDPNVIRDLVAIARHRGWDEIAVRGQTAFRREVWLAARREGLEVRGYRPTERDQQDLDRHTRQRANTPARQPSVDPMKAVETVVRSRVVEPAEQSRILALARERLARWLERGATVSVEPRQHQRSR
ncbi:MAG: LPD7 domain-containing protein [Pseudomonadota bacterium]